ncbi:MAG: hypothetical protein AAFP04_11570, partial [Myxococcota bacterium]
IAGFVGSMMRRDQEPGYSEIVGATPVPLGARLLGRALAAFGLVATLMLVPVIGSWVVMGIAAPASLSISTPATYFLFVYMAGLLELCAITIVLHATIQRAGVAYALSMLATFYFIVNNELGIVTYPIGALGIPARVTLSTLVGWEPWTPLIVGIGAFKLGVFGLACGIAWLAWPRGPIDRWTERFSIARERMFRSGAAVVLLASLALMLTTGLIAYDRLVVRGDYQAANLTRETQAEWERQWLPRAQVFSIGGGDVVAKVDPSARSVTARWTLRGALGTRLLGELPSGVTVRAATVQGQSTAVEMSNESFGIKLPKCEIAPGCEVVLDIEAVREGWPVEGVTPWLHSSQVWLTADVFLPRLGLDPGRRLAGPQFRVAHGLPREAPMVTSGVEVAALGVAPAGTWTWKVELPDGWSSPRQGSTNGPLDFAVVWLPAAPTETESAGLTAWHGFGYDNTAREILQDLLAMRACVSERLPGETSSVDTVLATPRESEVQVYGATLWLPEDAGWDVAPGGYGHWHRRRSIARALASSRLAAEANLRSEPGSPWLQEGIPGWIGLECVRALDGETAWLSLISRDAQNVVESLGALSAPAGTVSSDGDADWVAAYAPLASSAWASSQTVRSAADQVGEVVAAVANGSTVPEAMRAVLGEGTANALLAGPRAADVRLAVSASSGKSIEHGLRWRWESGGWLEDAPATEALVRPHGEQETQDRTTRVSIPSALDTDTPFTVLDPWPSFERSMSDNVWEPTHASR